MATMPSYDSKELYMMNGGNKLYIYKDGFGDVYKATPEEEKLWQQEVIDRALARIDVETNVTNLKFAIDDLLFHNVKDVDQLLIQKMQEATPVRKIVFATLLWTMKEYEQSFGIIYQLFLNHRKECIHEIFWGLNEFKNNVAARKFLLECIRGNDEELHKKAQTTIAMWAYTGMPELRFNSLFERIKLEKKDSKEFPEAVHELALMFGLAI